ncbi:MAG: hypothetical protein KQ78_01259 [Candidatus Izimaplasma bacterium HR2]|nr:MAG: hypothetical protein KQ78_01259 [Candidatus Izimaplasma bacterium HR2]
MKKVYFLIILLVVTFLTGCTETDNDHSFDVNESYILEPLLTVQRPVQESHQNEDVLGVETETVDVTDIDWQVKYESELYSILYRDVPYDMLFYMIGYPIEDSCSCNIGEKTRYQYVVYYNEQYYDIYEFHQKYNNLSCDFLEDIGIEYSVCVSEND